MTIIERCRYCSPSINDYFANEEYKHETEEREAINPRFLQNIAISLVQQELNDMGIIHSHDIADIIYSPIDTDLLIDLRTKFDMVTMSNILKKLNDEHLSDIRNIVNDNLVEDILVELVQYFHILFPTDIVWESIAISSDFYYSSARLRDHMSALLDKNISDDTISEQNIDVVKKFLEDIDQDRQNIEAILKSYLAVCPSYSSKILISHARRYDDDKLQNIEAFATKIISSDLLEKHHIMNDHHFEYYYANQTIPTREQVLFMTVAKFVSNKKDKAKTIEEIETFKLKPSMLEMLKILEDPIFGDKHGTE